MKKTLKEYRQLVEETYKDQNLEETIKIIYEVISEYPETFFDYAKDLGWLYIMTDNTTELVNIIKTCFDKGYCFPRFPEVMEKLDRVHYPELYKQWDSEIEKIVSDNWLKYIIVPPENYDKEKEYPLFIAIHGWGENAEFFKQYWKSDLIRNNYILGLVQSTQIIGTDTYIWNNDEIAHNDIKEFYEKITAEYKIDKQNIIVGGFSQGGRLSLDISFNKEYIPVKGFIALNPARPQVFDEEAVYNANLRGLKGYIITGDKDNHYNEQLNIKNAFDAMGFKCGFSVKMDWGHWFPDDLEDRIDNAINYINKM